MKQGAYISGAMHLAFMLFVLLSAFLPDWHRSEMIQVAEVSLISADEFDAAASAAPAVPAVDTVVLPQPAEAADETAMPEEEVAPDLNESVPVEEPAEADVEPDVSGVQALEAPVVEEPVQPDVEAEDAAPLGESLVEPVAIGNDAPSEVMTPSELVPEDSASDAPRIDTESAPEQPDDAVTSESVVEEVVEEQAAETVVEDPEPAAAPEEATTEITPEADDEQSAQAPVTASRPRGRPANLEAQVDAAMAAVAASEEQATAAAAAEAEAAAIEEAMQLAAAEIAAEAAATEEAVQAAPSLGAAMTAGEKDGLRLAVQKCWNVPAGLANASELVVVVGVELAQDGSLVGSPFMVEPSDDSAPGIKQAFEAGRRALIRCAPYDLPADKYEQWRNLEVVFNPESMVVR